MSVILIILGIGILYFWWRLLFRISDEKVHRHFTSWWTQRMPKAEAEGFQVANGVLFSVFILLAGIVLLFAGITRLLGWAGSEG